MTPKILVVGFGHMGKAIVDGLLALPVAKEDIQIVDMANTPAEQAARERGLLFHTGPDSVTFVPDVVLLAVKPQVADKVLPLYKHFTQNDTLFLSIMAGVTADNMLEAFGESATVVRSMPNMAAAVGKGMTILYAPPHVDEAQKNLAEQVMTAIGETAWLKDEETIHAATAISGCGPAWFFALTDVLAKAGESEGLPADFSYKLALQTAVGAGEMLAESSTPAADLVRAVASPGGVTEAGLETMADKDFPQVIQDVVTSAVRKSKQLAKS